MNEWIDNSSIMWYFFCLCNIVHLPVKCLDYEDALMFLKEVS